MLTKRKITAEAFIKDKKLNAALAIYMMRDILVADLYVAFQQKKMLDYANRPTRNSLKRTKNNQPAAFSFCGLDIIAALVRQNVLRCADHNFEFWVWLGCR